MYTGLAGPNGAVTSSLIDHYVKRSRSVGLVIIEHSFILPEGKLGSKQLGIYDDQLISGLEELSSRIHATGTPVVIQINHAGRDANSTVTGKPSVAPSARNSAKRLRINQLPALMTAFANAAQRAIKAGFDGVELHGAHGFLLNQFFSPLANRRRDKYGGPLENRMRFPLEVVKAVREETRGRLLLYRLGSDDLDPAGTQIQDSQKFARELEASGVDILDVSGGLCRSTPAKLQKRQGYFIPQAKKIKKTVNIPVIGVGGITEATFANRLIREGQVDLVAVGRALLADPAWASNAICQINSHTS
jgi:2,4-dienoyl-CoA reductase-like NADH-dependent reductase (Old Yellow Enzyme family)